MEQQAELPKIWCVGVAVCAASYTFDRLFSYIAMQEIPAGCRVVVPFGKGNAKRVGIVLSCAEQAAQPEQQLKPVLAVVDKQPILSPEMLDLVFWLKEMTFCTYYDAVRTILPAGMQVQLVETISLAEPQPDCPLTDAEAHLLFFLRGAKTKQEFRRILADADTQGNKRLSAPAGNGKGKDPWTDRHQDAANGSPAGRSAACDQNPAEAGADLAGNRCCFGKRGVLSQRRDHSGGEKAGAERRGGILYGEAAAAHICRQRSDPPARRHRAVRGTAGSI